MGVSAEILRNIQEATSKGHDAAVKAWQGQLQLVESLENAGVIKQLPHANQRTVNQPLEKASVSSSESVVLTVSQLVEKLHEELRAYGKDIKLPAPQPEFLEMHRIFEAEGFNMEPIVYLGKGKVNYALLDSSIRPDYDYGRQLFKDDGYVPILERGRKNKKIKITSRTCHVPAKSRFGVSVDEVHNFVAPEMIKASPRLGELVKATGAEVRVPKKDEFKFAGKLRYAHFGKANTQEWLYGNSWLGDQLFGGYYDNGGLKAAFDYQPIDHDDSIAFRLEAVLPSQKLG